MGHDNEGKPPGLLIQELTSELANHVLVLLECVLQDFLRRVHLPAPLSAHRVGVMSVGGIPILDYYPRNVRWTAHTLELYSNKSWWKHKNRILEIKHHNHRWQDGGGECKNTCSSGNCRLAVSPYCCLQGHRNIVLTGKQPSTLHPDNDLSVLNVVTFFFFLRELEGRRPQRLSPGVEMNHCLPVGLAPKLTISLLKINYWLVWYGEIIAQWQSL